MRKHSSVLTQYVSSSLIFLDSYISPFNEKNLRKSAWSFVWLTQKNRRLTTFKNTFSLDLFSHFSLFSYLHFSPLLLLLFLSFSLSFLTVVLRPFPPEQENNNVSCGSFRSNCTCIPYSICFLYYSAKHGLWRPFLDIFSSSHLFETRMQWKYSPLYVQVTQYYKSSFS